MLENRVDIGRESTDKERKRDGDPTSFELNGDIDSECGDQRREAFPWAGYQRWKTIDLVVRYLNDWVNHQQSRGV